MSTKVRLIHNLDPLTIPVTLIDGSEGIINLEPGEGWFDEDGILQLWSHTFSDGKTGNFRLIREINPYYAYVAAWNNQIIKLSRDFIRQHGADMIYDEVERTYKIADKDKYIHNIGRWLAKQFSYIVVDRITLAVDGAVGKEFKYFYREITTGEKVMNYPIKFQLLPAAKDRFKRLPNPFSDPLSFLPRSFPKSEI